MDAASQEYKAKIFKKFILKMAIVLLVPLLASLAAVICVLVYYHMTQSPKDHFARSLIESRNIPLKPSTQASEPLTNFPPSNTITDDNYRTEKRWPLEGLSQADAYENIQWHRDKGNFTEQELAAYEGYSDEILQQLINTHDILATMVMANRLLERRERIRAMETYYLAAVQGSLAALMSLSNLAEPDHQLGETLEGRKVVHRHATIERLAIFKTLSMRGDIRRAASEIEFLKERYPLSFYTDGQELVLSPEEQAYIDERSIQLYDELQENRYRIGLGKFDNSTSQVEQLLYNFMY